MLENGRPCPGVQFVSRLQMAAASAPPAVKARGLAPSRTSGGELLGVDLLEAFVWWCSQVLGYRYTGLAVWAVLGSFKTVVATATARKGYQDLTRLFCVLCQRTAANAQRRLIAMPWVTSFPDWLATQTRCFECARAGGIEASAWLPSEPYRGRPQTTSEAVRYALLCLHFRDCRCFTCSRARAETQIFF